MFSPYRRIFSAKGSLAFSATGFLSRLPLSMYGVATVVMIAQTRDSYALAGAIPAASLATTLVTVPWISRQIDRHGQAKVAVPAAVMASLMSLALILCTHFNAPTWTLFATAMLSATAPNAGGMVRARWDEIYRDDEKSMHVANSFEQVLDEVCFILGPILAVGLSTAFFPEAGRVAATVLTLVGTLLFAAQRDTEPPVRPQDPKDAGSPLRNEGLQVMLGTFLFTGVIFGSLEVVTVAYVASLGQQSLAGFVLALQAVGSALAGMSFGLLTPRGSSTTRFLLGIGAMALFMLPLNLAGNLVTLCLLMFVAGAATSPTMITSMTLVQELVPRSHLNEGMTLAVTALLGGISLGGAVGGWTVEHLSAHTGFWLQPAAATSALLIALMGSRRLSNVVANQKSVAETQSTVR